ncbi:GAF domain-containing protein [Catenuloplanes niger JCM 9533]
MALAEIAAGEHGDTIEAAHALTRWSLRLLDVRGVGVMMADDRGVLRSVVVSSDAVRVLEAAELDRGSGPCVESHRRARVVIHHDLDVPDDRWPEFGPQARAGGMRAAHAVPVRDGGTAIGVLNLFRASTGGLTAADAAVAQTLADAAGVAVSRPPAERQASTGEIAAALADAAVIERAKGMLAVRLRVEIDTAFAVMRRLARDRGDGLGDLAAAVVAGSITVALPLSVDSRPPDAAETE